MDGHLEASVKGAPYATPASPKQLSNHSLSVSQKLFVPLNPGYFQYAKLTKIRVFVLANGSLKIARNN